MAAQLDTTIRTITMQRNEQQAILTSLRESVIAVDSGEHVLFVNRAASALLGIDGNWAVGRLMQEVVRVGELQQFISTMLRSPAGAAQAEIRPVYNPTQVLQVTSTELRNATGARFGLLIVVNDVTRLRRLETIRREFVANVSHELKTPITAIKGFVETLADGGLADPDTARSFLARIAPQHRAAERDYRRLAAALAHRAGGRAGQHSAFRKRSLRRGGRRHRRHCAAGRRAPHHHRFRLRPRRVRARQSHAARTGRGQSARQRRQVQRPRLHRDAWNWRADGPDAAIHVRDRGMGVPPEHLARLFERFYRVDRARSRKLGGTGLGLAIVKHIVQAHAGRVTAQSTPGEGSTFSIFIPLGRREPAPAPSRREG